MFLVRGSTVRFLIHPFWKRWKYITMCFFRHLKKEGHSWWKIILSKLKCIFPFLAAKSVIWYYYSFNEISFVIKEGENLLTYINFPGAGVSTMPINFTRLHCPHFFAFLKLSVFAPQPTHTQQRRSYSYSYRHLEWHVLSDTKSLQFSLRKSACSATH